MPDVDVDRLIWIVTGVQLNAELGDRPLAYRVEQELKARLTEQLPPPAPGELPALVPAVISDVYYLNSEDEDVQSRPTITIGGPGVNALSAAWTKELQTIVAIENTLVVQMDLEMSDPRCAVWGMNHLDTVRAVELFISKYLDVFVKGIVGAIE
jgi:hypothetical protein